MKVLFCGLMLLVLFLFFIPQCEQKKPVDTLHDEKSLAVETKDFMSREEVLKIANSTIDLRAVMDESLDAESQERLANLTPINEMFEDYPTRIEQFKNKKDVELNEEMLPEDVDLRELSTPAKSQWNGTCSAFGLTSVQELMLCKDKGVCNVDISERHRWSMYKKYSAMSALETSNQFVADEKQWPQDQVNGPGMINGKYKIDDWEYLGDSKDKVIAELAKGNAIYMWSQTPNCLLKCKKVCAQNENSFANGGHAYAVVGYYQKDNPVLLIKNSWGEDCGDQGYQAMPFSIWDNASYWEAAVLRGLSVVGVEPTPPVDPTPPPIPAKVKKCEWRWSFKHFWTKRKYCWYE